MSQGKTRFTSRKGLCIEAYDLFRVLCRVPILFGKLKFFECYVVVFFFGIVKMVSNIVQELFHWSRKKLVIGKCFNILKMKKLSSWFQITKSECMWKTRASRYASWKLLKGLNSLHLGVRFFVLNSLVRVSQVKTWLQCIG